LLRAAARDDGKRLARWQQRVRAAGAAMAGAQPAMASLLTVVDLAFRAAERATSPAAGAVAVRAALDGYLARQGASVGAAAARLVRLLPPRATCLTLSSSAVASRAFLLAHRQGRLGRLVVAESRPGCEGLGLAARMAAAGVQALVIVDALAPARAATVDVVVVGADAVTPRAVWNKCGTLGLALGARAARRPFLVVTPSDRLVPAALARRLRVPDAEPEDVLAAPPRGVGLENRLFDQTPLALVTRVVTEEASLTAAGVRRRLARRPVAAWWRRLSA